MVSDKKLWHFYEWAGDLDGNYFSEDENKNENGKRQVFGDWGGV